MEKQSHSSFEPAQAVRPPKKPRASSPYLVAILASCLLYYTFTRDGTWFPLRTGTPEHADKKPLGYHDVWDTLISKPYLDYQTCYDDFQCARLELPMDYWNGTTNETVSIAVIKKPARVPVTHPQYGGAVLHNPGGPGGSGVGFVLGAGDAMQEIIGDPNGLQFDHIGFDPRGILFSQPNVECFADPDYESYWFARVIEEGLYSSSDAAFGRLWSMAAAQSGSCSLPAQDGRADIKQYVNTAFVARDMLEIVERHGEWREAEARRLLKQQSRCGAHGGSAVNAEDSKIIESLKYRPGEEKINYWGFSYGTYLGNTFAAMFPDRINRLAVDGVVDAYDYRKTLWLDNLVDTEKDLNLLYYHCARVGYPKCALGNQSGDTTMESVEARVKKISASLYHNPLPIISYEQPGIITYSDIKGFLFGALYSPIPLFEVVAEILYELETGTFASNLELQARFGHMVKAVGSGATMAIACSDGESQNGVTKDDFRQHVKELEELSPNLGEMWASLRLSCIHYSVRAHYRFTADWTGKTSHPIMAIGNTADPVTPGRYAKKMAQGFEGAVALIQDSPGHCSLAASSNCTISYVRRYFQTGELPEEGTVCPVDEVPFGPADDEEVEVLSVEGQRLRNAHKKMSEAFLAAGGGWSRSGVGRMLA